MPRISAASAAVTDELAFTSPQTTERLPLDIIPFSIVEDWEKTLAFMEMMEHITWTSIVISFLIQKTITISIVEMAVRKAKINGQYQEVSILALIISLHTMFAMVI